MSDIPQLNEITTALKEGRKPIPVTIRTFLSWFGAKRRTKWNVEYINEKMEEAGLQPVPGYLDMWVDTFIRFETVSQYAAKPTSAESAYNEPSNTNIEQAQNSPLELTSADDPSFRIERIESAKKRPVSVKPNASLQEAMMLMLAHNFSQVPVMTNDRDVKGVVSWASIGARIATNTTGPDVSIVYGQSSRVERFGFFVLGNTHNQRL